MQQIRQYVETRKEQLKAQIAKLERAPFLVIVQVNDDEASNTYIRGKLADAAEVGINAELLKLPTTISEGELLDEITALNHDNSVDGFIVQMPLPKHISEEKVKQAVGPSKDVDGFHPMSLFNPCTPLGVMNYLTEQGVSFEGKNALVIGRSNIVGKPMAKLLLQANANVTVVHSRTKEKDLRNYVKNADIIVVAVGIKHFLNKTFTYKKEAIVVDVGINRQAGITYGDAESDLPIYFQTPVPGGVGLLTRLTLLENLLEGYNNGI
ncbi:MAG: bifunctional 5,10-methylenetetrahydrofolate dehydrogenase/5,10-methenyltetrahydrofolate cyclohydrolase [Erysipelotrichaceae bacterium]|nr:bifunctional 5,10-methylenetetrahydrofolate dehydrogenase/5,10-methenyltetrahydrofolate cyclohydrolase [Erysipelotrichaceae bacterium]